MSQTDPMDAVRAELRVALERKGFESLTAVQRAVLESSTHERNIRISSETGSGKTVAIGLAIAPDLLERSKQDAKRKGPLALIIVPTRELAVQVREELSWLFAELPRFRTAVVTGGTDIQRERRALSPAPHLLVGTPGRLLDHMRSGNVRFESLRHVALDEADRMLDMGFAEELDEIIAQLPEDRRSHLVSATFPRGVRRLADSFQSDALLIEGTRLGKANENIEHTAHLVHASDRYAAVVNSLLLLDGAKCLIFVQRRSDTSELAEKLAGDGFAAMPISGDLNQAQRTRSLNAFRNGLVSTLVATDVAARGIDVADIAAVIHGDLPRAPDDYIHRSGRTGRAGKQGRSIALVTPNQQRQARRLFETAKVDVTWEALPTAKKIEKTLVKRWRARLHRQLAGHPPPELTTKYARHLLQSHGPEQLVAVLLDMAQPELPRRAIDIEPVHERSDGGRTAGVRFARDSGRDRHHPGKARKGKPGHKHTFNKGRSFKRK